MAVGHFRDQRTKSGGEEYKRERERKDSLKIALVPKHQALICQ